MRRWPLASVFSLTGFNVYHSIVEALQQHKAKPMKWLDLIGLCRSYLSAIGRDATLERVFYFSAAADFSPPKGDRWFRMEYASTQPDARFFALSESGILFMFCNPIGDCMPKRVVVEASRAEKHLLDTYLQSHGTSLADWFSDRVSEATAAYRQTPDQGRISRGDSPQNRSSEAILAQLAALDWAFTEVDTGYLTHSVHPYPAKFIPQIPGKLIRHLSDPGDVIWDPFGGSGTAAVEAVLLGRRVISSDVNPLSEIIGKAKTTRLGRDSEAALRRLATNLEVLGHDVAGLEDFARNHSGALETLTPVIPHLERWFAPAVVIELSLIRWHVARLPSAEAQVLGQCALSRIVVRVSFQDGETRYASKPRKVERGSVLRAYAAELVSHLSRARAFSSATTASNTSFLTADLRVNPVVAPNSVDLVVTSPPYPNATDYHLYHRFRLMWLGFNPSELAKREIGSHLRHQRESTGIQEYLTEMRSCLGHILEGLRPNCFAALVIGDGVFKGARHPTSKLLGDVATEIGFENVGTIDRNVHSTRRSFIAPARRLRSEQILLLRKPNRRSLFLIRRPMYRLWPYEEQLRLDEIRAVTGTRLVRDSDEGAAVLLDSSQARAFKKLTFSQSFESEHFAPERTWQSVLENGDHRLGARKDPKYAGHGIHDYKGKFYPQLVKALFNLAQIEAGSSILDPFCGSGTVLLEARLNGYRALGIDLNPLATRIASAKCGVLDEPPEGIAELADSVITAARRYTEKSPQFEAPDEDSVAELRSWFAEPILKKLLAIRAAIQETPQRAVRDLLSVCLSAIVRDVSHQDPKDLRIRRRKTALRDAPVIELFAARVTEALARLRRFHEARPHMPWAAGTASVTEGDARQWATFTHGGVNPGSVDLVVTSPPYATALPYIDTDRLSLLLLFGLHRSERAAAERALTGSREIAGRERSAIEEQIDSRDFDHIPSRTAKKLVTTVLSLNRSGNVGFRRRNQAALMFRYFADITRILQNIDRAAKKSSSMFFVIGDSKTTAGRREVVIKTGAVVQELGASLGWKIERVVPITVTREARPHVRNSITENEIIWFRRQSS